MRVGRPRREMMLGGPEDGDGEVGPLVLNALVSGGDRVLGTHTM